MVIIYITLETAPYTPMYSKEYNHKCEFAPFLYKTLQLK